ncbi:hypothetical protein ACHAWX_001306 [Stephanocyclus meneghinianus]
MLHFNNGAAAWMASNLHRMEGGMEFYSIIKPVLTHLEAEVDLVMAGKKSLLITNIANGLQNIQLMAGSRGRFRMHTLEKVGYWVDVDDLEVLLELMVGALR